MEQGMRIVGLTDIHGNVEKIPSLGSVLAEADLILLAGDITHFGARREALEVLEAVGIFNDAILAVAGNCDTDSVEATLTESGVNLHARTSTHGSYLFAGLGGSLPTPGGVTPNEYSEEELERSLQSASSGIAEGSGLVMVSHQPPLSCSCDIVGDAHVGSRSVRAFIERCRPLLCLTGHIHEGIGIGLIGTTKVINPGPLSGATYALIELEGSRAELRIMKGRKTVMEG
jgi:Icc-related predicted phosphoesterase